MLDKQLVLFSAEKDATPNQRKTREVVVNIIHARTLSILRRFESDGERKASVIWFLKRVKVTTDLAGSLSGADLSGAHLNNIFLGTANLVGAKFNSAYLVNAFFQGADLTGAEIKDAHCHLIDFRDAALFRADFTGADMREAKLSKAKLHNAKLIQAILKDAQLDDAQLYGVDLSDADLRGANLSNAKLDRADLSNIKFDFYTQWPNRETLAKTKNLPKQLKVDFGIRQE